MKFEYTKEGIAKCLLHCVIKGYKLRSVLYMIGAPSEKNDHGFDGAITEINSMAGFMPTLECSNLYFYMPAAAFIAEYYPKANKFIMDNILVHDKVMMIAPYLMTQKFNGDKKYIPSKFTTAERNENNRAMYQYNQSVESYHINKGAKARSGRASWSTVKKTNN